MRQVNADFFFCLLCFHLLTSASLFSQRWHVILILNQRALCATGNVNIWFKLPICGQTFVCEFEGSSYTYKEMETFKTLYNHTEHTNQQIKALTWFSWQGPWQYSVRVSSVCIISPTLVSLMYNPSKPSPPVVLPQMQSRNCSVSPTKL